MLIFGIAIFAQAHLDMGGFVTVLWMLTLFAFGFRIGRVGEGETLRQVNVVGLLLVILGMQSLVLAGKLLLRRIGLRMAASQLRLLVDQLSAVMLTGLTRDGYKYRTSEWPSVTHVHSWVWATMLFFSFLFLFYMHSGFWTKGMAILASGNRGLVRCVSCGKKWVRGNIFFTPHGEDAGGRQVSGTMYDI